MIVQCRHCGGRYKIQVEKIPPEGRQFRCTKCGEFIKVKLPGDSNADSSENHIKDHSKAAPPPPTATGKDVGKAAPPPTTGKDVGKAAPPLPPTTGKDVGKATPPLSPATGKDVGKAAPPPTTGKDVGKAAPPPTTGKDVGKAAPPTATGKDVGKAAPPPATGKDTSKSAAKGGDAAKKGGEKPEASAQKVPAPESAPLPDTKRGSPEDSPAQPLEAATPDPGKTPAAEPAPSEVKPPATATVPLSQAFYRKTVLLSTVKHRTWRMAVERNYDYAASTHAVLLNAPEFKQACAYYPIVFQADPPHHPMVMLGLTAEENLFVDANGEWMKDTYIPLYVNRYPFMLQQNPGTEQLNLCIDDECPLFSVGNQGHLLLDESGRPTPYLLNEMETCRVFLVQSQITTEFVKALMAQGMLCPGTIEMKDHTNLFHISDFLVLEEGHYALLPDSVVIEWQRKGWLAMVHWCQASQGNWKRLLHLKGQRNQRK